MKTTTRLYDIIYSYYNKLYGDFKRGNKIVYFDKEFQFTHKIAKYDDEVKTVCRDTIFYGLDFLDDNTRDKFESEFITRFMSRSIKFQTSSQFNLRLVSYCRGISSIINDYYINMEKLARGVELTTSHSEETSNSQSNNDTFNQSSGNDTSKSSSNDRSASADVSLPQDNASVDISSDNVEYADNVSHNKSSDSSESLNTSYSNTQNTSEQTNNTNSQNDSNTETMKFDTNQLFLLQKFHDDLFNDLDKQLFSQIL